jgi:hypothetical protein
MFDYLLDNLNRTLGDPRSARWHRVIDAFKLKYPDIDICDDQLWTNNAQDNLVPAGFLVWRIGREGIPSDIGIYSRSESWVEGKYIVQLFPALGTTAESEYRRLNTRERGLYVYEAKSVDGRTVITGFGKFGYDGTVGELTPRGGDDFSQLVLREDAQRYSNMGRRIK